MLDKYTIKTLLSISKTFEKNLSKLCWDFYDIPVHDASNKQFNKFEDDLIELIFEYWDGFDMHAQDGWYEDEDGADWDRSGIWNSVARDLRGRKIIFPDWRAFELHPGKTEERLRSSVRDLHYDDILESIDGDTMTKTYIEYLEDPYGSPNW